jgi:hypothetical protein
MKTDETQQVPTNEPKRLVFTVQVRRTEKPAADDAPEAESGPVRA